MDSVPSITFLVGLALIVIALLGGGFEVKEIKLPVLGIFPRLLSFVIGTVLVALALFSPEIIPEGHRPTPTLTPAPTATLSASPTWINAGQSSTLMWRSTNATGCSGTNFTPNGTSGSMVVTPSDTTLYSITCADAGGVSHAASATVKVTASPLSPAPTASLLASPTWINAGQTSTLTWGSTNATGCSGTNFIPSGTSGSVAVTPSDTTIYSITCAGGGGMSPAASATVTVTAPETLWIQNGSIMSLVSKEDAVEINYESPTVEMQSLGIIKGTPKFKGKRNGQQYNGIAYVYSKQCSKGFDYGVKGNETADHMLITLKGKAPVRLDNTCRVHHYDETAAGSILEFWAIDRGIAGRAYVRDRRENKTNSIH
jgi:hypothetical protein